MSINQRYGSYTIRLSDPSEFKALNFGESVNIEEEEKAQNDVVSLLNVDMSLTTTPRRSSARQASKPSTTTTRTTRRRKRQAAVRLSETSPAFMEAEKIKAAAHKNANMNKLLSLTTLALTKFALVQAIQPNDSLTTITSLVTRKEYKCSSVNVNVNNILNKKENYPVKLVFVRVPEETTNDIESTPCGSPQKRRRGKKKADVQQVSQEPATIDLVSSDEEENDGDDDAVMAAEPVAAVGEGQANAVSADSSNKANDTTLPGAASVEPMDVVDANHEEMSTFDPSSRVISVEYIPPPSRVLASVTKPSLDTSAREDVAMEQAAGTSDVDSQYAVTNTSSTATNVGQADEERAANTSVRERHDDNVTEEPEAPVAVSESRDTVMKEAETPVAVLLHSEDAKSPSESAVVARPDATPGYEVGEWVLTPFGPGIVESFCIDRFADSLDSLVNPILSYQVSLPFGTLFVMSREVQPFDGSPYANETVVSVSKPSLTRGDVVRLRPGVYLNDSLVNFFLQRQPRNDKVHVFSSYFYTRIADLASTHTMSSPEFHSLLWKNIKGWIKNVDIWKMDMLVIPIHDRLHWSVVAVCHPGLLLHPNEEDERVACLLHLDSGKRFRLHTSSVLFNRIRVFLQVSLKEQHQVEMESLPGGSPPVPAQANETDCGVYMMEWIERLLNDGLTVTQEFIDAKANVPPFGKTAFPQSLIDRKRNDFQSLIYTLSREEGGSS